MLTPTAAAHAADMIQEHDLLTARFHNLDTTLVSGALRQMTQMVYKPNHYGIYELVPPEIYSVYGESSLWWVDARQAWTADAIWERFNSASKLERWPVSGEKRRIWINNWRWGGPRKYSGFRPPDCSEGSPLSQHRCSRATDMIIEGITAEEVREDIRTHLSVSAYQFITAVELDVDWLHTDCRNTGSDQIMWIKP